jgi:hypothetical protein
MPKGWQRERGRSNMRKARKLRYAQIELNINAIARISEVSG